MPLPLLLYLALCLMVAYLGRQTRLGFFRCFLFSVIVTPVIMTLYLLMFTSLENEARRKQEDRRRP
ncbi:hypothetical protein [Parachitinimonas caeni]|uniref:Uncharacterized protein n=1 Tax=Parachitinimonas caeni TaxID=3031301 RepID=A0ABT7DWG2_9NEIS|nr:hypothetical protein [Parachitinimonas caeni]MDK2124401.1 hypothetical protein [Parachitinimonas caeni]